MRSEEFPYFYDRTVHIADLLLYNLMFVFIFCIFEMNVEIQMSDK